MVDLHCHILPDVDDGARNIEESLEMLRKSAAAGVEVVVATPHLIRGVYEMDSYTRLQMTAELQEAADQHDIRIQVKPGVEYYLSPQILEDLDRLEKFTINNNGRYLLVELPMQDIPLFTGNIFSTLKAKGITPVLAHPERNLRICQNPNILFDLIAKGCIPQINAGSILGYYGGESRKTALKLLTHGLANVIASDMHSPDSLTMDQAVPVVEKLLGKERASRLFTETPRQILAGEVFQQKEKPQQFETQKKRFWGLFPRKKKQNQKIQETSDKESV